ncbi:MAG: protein kinase, partial [Planctomycetes bacterium]|nr:protein kinase [Planctomycetota bacterium]
MPGNNLLIGQIALEKRLVTPEQIREALKDQPRMIGAALVAKGFITDEQLVELIEEQNRRLGRPADYGRARSEDLLFGKLLARSGRASEEQVNVALRTQQELAEEGASKRLGEILVETGQISPDAVHETLKLQVAPEIAQAMEDPQRVFGKFVLLREIGRGGFGAVYRAWQRDLGRFVALKFLESSDPEGVRRFAREAQTAAKLNHPNIVPIYEVGEQAGRHFISMEFIDGRTLDKARLPARRAAEALRDAALAVHFAHGRDIVHRDLKPENLMLDAAGHVWVMDFGLAREVQGGTTMTASGVIVGTPAFMAPEQASGKRCDARSDVYSLGATLYALLCGRPPFAGATALDIVLQVRERDPARPRSVEPKVHPELETIVLKAMEKEPARRYLTAADFAEDLRRFLDGEPIGARRASVIYRLRKAALRHKAIAVGVLAAVAALGYFAGPGRVEVHGEKRFVWPAGTRTQRFAREGYDTQVADVRVAPWSTTRWSPPLVLDHGWLTIVSDPPGAEVRIDDGPAFLADGSRLRVLKGRHEMRLRLADHEDLVEPIHVPAGGEVAFKRVLVHEVGQLWVTCRPEGVKMTVSRADGKRVGTFALPVESLALPTGEYDLVFEKENYFPRRTKVTVRKWRRRSFDHVTGLVDGRGVTWQREPDETYAHATLSPMELWSFKTEGPVIDRPALADLDGDGVLDCVIGSHDSKVYAISGRDGAKLWEFKTGSGIESSPALADLNGDGVPDCVVGSDDSQIYAISGRDGAKLWEFMTLGAVSSSPALADLNGDGVPDCVAGSDDSKVYALSGRNGTKLWEFETGGTAKRGELKTGSEVRSSPALADLNGDGVPDCVVGSDDSQIYAISGRDG